MGRGGKVFSGIGEATPGTKTIDLPAKKQLNIKKDPGIL